MQAYTSQAEVNKPVESATIRPGQWSLRRRLGWTWDQNPNHESGAHSKRRVQLERRYERAEKMRAVTLAAIRRELERAPADTELASWAAQLATLTPAVVGALYDPASRGPGGARRAWWYLPDEARELAALVVRIVRRTLKALRYLGRARVVASARATAAYLGRALALSRLPHSVPPQTPEEKQEVKTSSKPEALKHPMLRQLREIEARHPELRAARQEEDTV